MSTDYPGAIDSFDTHVDNVDDVMAADVNDLNDAVVAIQTESFTWTTWTPVLTQGVAKTHTVTSAKYKVIGKMCHMICALVCTEAGAAATAITVSGWPAALDPYQMGTYAGLGTGGVYDVGVTFYTAILVPAGASGVQIFWPPTGAYIGVNPNITLANTDEIYINGLWRIA